MEQDNWHYSLMDNGTSAYGVYLDDRYSYTGDRSISTTPLWIVLNNIGESTTNTYGKMSMMVYVDNYAAQTHRYLAAGMYQSTIGSGDWRYGIVCGLYSNGVDKSLRCGYIKTDGTTVSLKNSSLITSSLPSVDRWYKLQMTWKRVQNAADSGYYWSGLIEMIDQNTDEVLGSLGSTWIDAWVNTRDLINNEYNVGIVTYTSVNGMNIMDDWKLYDDS